MGSKSSKSSNFGQQKHGNFQDQNRCSCDSEKEKVKIVEWISVPSMSSSLYAASSAGLFFLNIIPGMLFVTRGQKPCHDAINVKLECSNPKCRNKCWYTIEYTDGGRKSKTGYYGNFKVNQRADITKDMNMKDLYNIYDKNSSDWTKEKYSLLYHNCKDFASEKYYDIVANYCNNN